MIVYKKKNMKLFDGLSINVNRASNNNLLLKITRKNAVATVGCAIANWHV